MYTIWKKPPFKINEIYGGLDKGIHLKKANVNRFSYQTKPVITNKKFFIHRWSTHLCIDLTKSQKELLSEMSKTMRYKIRRAERDKVSIEFIENPNVDDVKRFALFYDSFADTKGIELCKFKKLIDFMEEKTLLISYVYHEDGRILASSATGSTNGTAIGLYGASGRFEHRDLSGQFISRANRYLHWHEMIYFKKLGYHTFNMMGLARNKTNISQQGIHDYKKGYGGEERTIYQSLIPQNALGVCLIGLFKFLWRNDPEILSNKQPYIDEYFNINKKKA